MNGPEQVVPPVFLERLVFDVETQLITTVTSHIGKPQPGGRFYLK